MGEKLIFLVLSACVGLSATRAVEEPPTEPQNVETLVLNQEFKEILYKPGQPLALDCGVVKESKDKLNFKRLVALFKYVPNKFEKSFHDKAVRLWNALPEDIRRAPTVDSFKTRLRKHFLNSFTWTINGEPLELNENVIIPKQKDRLVILQTTPETKGVYQCFVTSDLGTATSAPLSVRPTYFNIPKVTPERLTPVEGDPLELRCPETISAYPKPKITWMYQHGVDPSISHTILDPRITSAPNGVLYFSNVTEEDVNKNFKYVCMAKNPAVDEPVALAEYVLEGLKKKVGDDSGSTRVAQYVSVEETSKEGDVTALYCIYGGNPLIPPDWYFNGVLITGGPNDRVTEHNRSKGKRLLIRDTRLSDQGQYHCVIPGDQDLTKVYMQLKVVSVPKFVTKPIVVTNANEGDDVTIPCQITGIPDPTITWTFNGKPLKEDSSYTISRSKENNKEGRAIFTANLDIKQVKNANKGYYGCKASNENGEIYAESLLFVKS